MHHAYSICIAIFGIKLIIIIIIKNEKIRVTLCENAVGALYIVNKSLKLYQQKKITAAI